MIATIGKHPERHDVWAVFVPCDNDCIRFDGRVPGHERGSNWAWVPCGTCNGTMKRVLSTHATRDGAVVSCNQINEADRAPV